jgi:hypothetical protein
MLHSLWRKKFFICFNAGKVKVRLLKLRLQQKDLGLKINILYNFLQYI